MKYYFIFSRYSDNQLTEELSSFLLDLATDDKISQKYPGAFSYVDTKMYKNITYQIVM